MYYYFGDYLLSCVFMNVFALFGVFLMYFCAFALSKCGEKGKETLV